MAPCCSLRVDSSSFYRLGRSTISAATRTNPIINRMQRRVQVLYIDGVRACLACLRTIPHELGLLVQEPLIDVVNFFRDPKVLDMLECETIPGIFRKRGPGIRSGPGGPALRQSKQPIPSQCGCTNMRRMISAPKCGAA
jgi:hypothetical protein